jgi:serine/threonine-protein kinase
MAAGFSHPNIVPVHAVEEHPQLLCFVMGFIEGETLGGRVRRGGPLGATEAVRLLQEVAWALSYAHGRGVVHRDIKPDNILIERGSGRALVTDFGIARARNSSDVANRLTLEGQLLGTAAFMSPEQGADEPVDGRSDLYALGGVGYFALVGRAPFEATTLEAMLVARYTRAAPPVASARPDVPHALAAAIDRCLAREPHDRYPSAEVVAEALSEATGITGAEYIALPVRSFLRAAEQSVWLATLVVVFTLIYGLPGTRNVLALVAGIVFGVGVLSIDLVRRARELQGEGFGAADVRRGFEVERQTHAEELRQLFDARRTAARRRTRRRAWTTLAVGVVLRVAAQFAFLPHAQQAPPAPWQIAVLVLLDLTNTVSLVVALNTSPRTERRGFRIAAWVWQSRFAVAFFRLSAVGRGQSTARSSAAGRDSSELQLAELTPAAVTSRFPELPAMLRRLEESQAAMRLRELEVARALADAGGTPVTKYLDGTSPSGKVTSGVKGGTNQDTLEVRRNALLDEMRDTLERTRTRRATLAAALENVRIQLLRIGAGMGAPDDMREEVAILSELVESHSEATVAMV